MTESCKRQRDLEQRTFTFAVNVVNFLKKMKTTKINNVVIHQLTKSATSVGANYEEAQGASSKDDFLYKISICFREAKESNYWLRLVEATDIHSSKQLSDLIQESDELKKIFRSMLKKMKS